MSALTGLCSHRVPCQHGGMPSASARAAKLLLFASRPELPRACQLWWGAAIIPSNPFNHRRSTLSRPNSACTVCLSICKSRLFLLLSLTPHSQDTHSPSAIPHCVASLLACTRYAAAFVPPTARLAWLCFRWGGQLHSDSTVIADTDNTSNTLDITHTSIEYPHNAWILAGYRSRGLEGPHRAPRQVSALLIAQTCALSSS